MSFLYSCLTAMTCQGYTDIQSTTGMFLHIGHVGRASRGKLRGLMVFGVTLDQLQLLLFCWGLQWFPQDISNKKKLEKTANCLAWPPAWKIRIVNINQGSKQPPTKIATQSSMMTWQMTWQMTLRWHELASGTPQTLSPEIRAFSSKQTKASPRFKNCWSTTTTSYYIHFPHVLGF